MFVEAIEGVESLIVIIWLFFALQSNKYKKQGLCNLSKLGINVQHLGTIYEQEFAPIQ